MTKCALHSEVFLNELNGGTRTICKCMLPSWVWCGFQKVKSLNAVILYLMSPPLFVCKNSSDFVCLIILQLLQHTVMTLLLCVCLCVCFPADNPSLLSHVTVTVQVLDVNDNPPEIATDEEVIVCESSRPGQVSIWCDSWHAHTRQLYSQTHKYQLVHKPKHRHALTYAHLEYTHTRARIPQTEVLRAEDYLAPPLPSCLDDMHYAEDSLLFPSAVFVRSRVDPLKERWKEREREGTREWDREGER